LIAGHFALAAAVRSRDKSAPLWALMLATQWLDVVFIPLFVVGAESIFRPGHAGGERAGALTASILRRGMFD
jgi:hypothetical protein